MADLQKFLEDRNDLQNNIQGLISNFLNEYQFVNSLSIEIPTITIALGRRIIGNIDLTVNV